MNSQNQEMWTPIARIESVSDAEYALMLLQKNSIESRLVTQDQSAILEVRKPADIQAAMALLSYLQKDSDFRAVHRALSVPPAKVLSAYPVVMSSLMISVLGWWLVTYRFDWVHYFTFQDFRLFGNSVSFATSTDAIRSGEYWRVLTPAFLHFGVFHLAFNSLWLWELGRRIEKLAGSLHLLMVLLLTAVAANMFQYFSAGASIFGGMSGCVYGLLGYIWLRNKTAPNPLLKVAPGLIGLMVGWLVLCMTGIVDLFIGGGVANGTHLGGLVTGMLLGAWSGWVTPAAK